MVEDDFCREWLSALCELNNNINELKSQLSISFKAVEYDPEVGVVIEPLIINRERDAAINREIQYAEQEMNDILVAIRPMLK